MRVGENGFQYNWIDRWASIPDTPSGRMNGRTHGVVVSSNGDVLVFNQADPAILEFSSDGILKRYWGDRFHGAHGLTLVQETGAEYLWLTDQDSAEVVKTTLDGRTLMNLERPPHPAYTKGTYAPTWVAVNEERFGGNGDVWVADGYGMNYVHRFDKHGGYIGSINGAEGQAGALNCPHGIWIDWRNREPELYIADRGNRRFQVYDAEGTYKRSFGEAYLSCPCTCISYGEFLLVAELSAKLTVLDANDQLVCYIGNNEQTCGLPGWPNHAPELIVPGKFNSPHSMAVDQQGNLYVVEWIIGGRITKLAIV
jgi:DNA-binding beta-propeller fold protein YncE